MFSYSYQPQTTPLSSPVPTQSPKPKQHPIHGTEDEMELIGDDMVTLDSLIGVAALDQAYSFVKYKFTEKHKECGVLKVNYVQQINMFIQTLRNENIPIETCLHTLMPSSKKTLWIRVSLKNLTELKLKPLWKIKGIVQLYPQEQRVTIKIDDHSLDPCILHPQRLLCAQPDRHHTEESLTLAKEGLIDHERCEHDESGSEREDAAAERAEDRAQVTQKRKTRTLGENEAMDPYRKGKTLTNGSHVSPGSEPEGRREDKVQKERCHTPNVVHTNFNQGMQTRMKVRQLQQPKRETNTMYTGRRRMRRLYNKSPYPISLRSEDGGLSQLHPCPVPKAHPEKVHAAQATMSHVEPCAAVPEASRGHLRGEDQRSLESPNTNAVEQHFGDPNAVSVASGCILPSVHQRHPLRSQPPESQHKPACDQLRAQGPRTLGCLLM